MNKTILEGGGNPDWNKPQKSNVPIDISKLSGTNLPPIEPICDRHFTGAYTARIIDGVAHCPSCNAPVSEHTR